jgi:NAD(P)-dependent dehydrogenase (short-subunit alcohol dehydrogenase family)
VVVTGAASGIGRAAAELFGREGAKAVVVADVNESGGEETVGLVEASGAAASFVKCDVAEAADVEALIETAVSRYGRLDCAFNNAGVSQHGTFGDETTVDAYDRVSAVNLKSVWLCMQYEIRQMLEQGACAIVNTASRAGIRGVAGSGIYSATKHGVVGLTKSAALECAAAGVRINAILPGLVATPMMTGAAPEYLEMVLQRQPGRRAAAPQEIAEAAVWLCSDRASFVSGAALSVDLATSAG